jgi:hypothetical protein
MVVDPARAVTAEVAVLMNVPASGATGLVATPRLSSTRNQQAAIAEIRMSTAENVSGG